MPVPHQWHAFASRAELAQSLAKTIADKLSAGITRRGTGFIAVSGGSTPALLFPELSKATIDWKKVTITLIDERLVPPTSPRSNARLVADKLLQGPAAAANFVPLYHGTDDPEAAATLARSALGPLPWPLDVAVLGMGGDGHTASFFPDAPNLAELLAADAEKLALPVEAASAGEHRLTLTLGKIADAGLLVLHIEGAEKRAVLDRALGAENLPIRAAFEAAPRPVEIFWAE
jgi:6-phosphogluconolactonase